MITLITTLKLMLSCGAALILVTAALCMLLGLHEGLVLLLHDLVKSAKGLLRKPRSKKLYIPVETTTMKVFKRGQIVLYNLYKEFTLKKSIMCIVESVHRDNDKYVVLSPFVCDKEAVSFGELNFWTHSSQAVLNYLDEHGGTSRCYNVYTKYLTLYKRTATEQCMNFVRHNIPLDSDFCKTINAAIGQKKRRQNAAKRV